MDNTPEQPPEGWLALKQAVITLKKEGWSISRSALYEAIRARKFRHMRSSDLPRARIWVQISRVREWLKSLQR